MTWYTVNYLLASYLQTEEGGRHKIAKVEKVRPGKARFYFELAPDQAEALQLKFHQSAFMEFESIRKQTINLCY